MRVAAARWQGELIAAAQSVEAMEEVVHTAEQLHRRLTGESDLRLALLEPDEGPGEEEGTVAWTHYNGEPSPAPFPRTIPPPPRSPIPPLAVAPLRRRPLRHLPHRSPSAALPP